MIAWPVTMPMMPTIRAIAAVARRPGSRDWPGAGGVASGRMKAMGLGAGRSGGDAEMGDSSVVEAGVVVGMAGAGLQQRRGWAHEWHGDE